MSRTSKRVKKNQLSVMNVPNRYRTAAYGRLSEKDGGHGRKDSIVIQMQIIHEYIKKHPEMELIKEYVDNGISGTTYNRTEFKHLMDEVRRGKIDCIVVKDFSRLGRNLIDTLDLLDVILPTLGIRFISILDDYDSENPESEKNRTQNIQRHFMNEFYAKEVSKKLIQAHETSRNKGEFWGARPPYGYKRSEQSKKKLVPDEQESKVVSYIFECYVFRGMSTIEITRDLNAKNITTPDEKYEFSKKRQGKQKIWGGSTVSIIIQNPAYIGHMAYGKTKQMFYANIPYHLIPRNQWDIKENVMEPIIEKAVFEEAQKIIKTRWEISQKEWAKNEKVEIIEGVFKGIIFCGNCHLRLARNRVGSEKYSYRCPNHMFEYDGCKLGYLREDVIVSAVREALLFQIKLAGDFQKKFGAEFIKELHGEYENKECSVTVRLHEAEAKIDGLYEDYQDELLNKEEYLDLKNRYQSQKEKITNELAELKDRYQKIRTEAELKEEWAEQLVFYQKMDELTREMVVQFIERITVYSKERILVNFWFGDIFLRNTQINEGKGEMKNAG